MSENFSRWTDLLEEDELGFVKQFLLVSGSLKDLAGRYGVSVLSREQELVSRHFAGRPQDGEIELVESAYER